MKNLIISLGVVATIVLPMTAQDKPTATISTPFLQVPVYHVSANNQWIAGEWNGVVSRYNIGSQEEDSFYEDLNPGTSGKGIANDGTVVGSYGVDNFLALPSIWTVGASAWSELTLPAECSTMGACTQGITGDGTYIAGYGQLANSLFYCPLLWTKGADGQYSVEMLPWPEKDLWGMMPQMAIAQGVSEDGRVVYGRYVDFTGFCYFGIVWKKTADNTWSYKLIGEDYVIIGTENPGPQPQLADYVTADPETEPDLYWQQVEAFDSIIQEWTNKANAYARLAVDPNDRISTGSGCISGNGHYLCVSIPDEPRVYDLSVESEEAGYAFTSYPLAEGLVTSVANDGTAMFASPVGMQYRTAYIVPAGETEMVTLSDWLNENYEVSYAEGSATNDIDFGTVKISYDGKFIIAANGGSNPDELFHNTIIELSEGAGVGETGFGVEGAILRGTVLSLPVGAARVDIYDVSGKQVAGFTADGDVELSSYADGFVIVKVSGRNGVQTFKVIL